MSEVSYGEAIRMAHAYEMRTDDSVVVLGLDIADLGGVFGVTAGLLDEFGPSRIMDCPIAEAGYIGAGIGLALEGFRPIIEVQFADFVTVGFDQIVSVAAKEHMVTGGASSASVVVRLPYGASSSGGYMGGAGPCHSQSPEAWFCHTPGLVVVMPSTPRDALGLLRAAVRADDPVIFMEQKGMYESSTERIDAPEDVAIDIGVARTVRSGTDLTVVATGATVAMSVEAADRLGDEGISLEVIDPRTLVPLDVDAIISSVERTGRLVVAHEAHLSCGIGSEIVARVVEHAYGALRAPIKRVTALDMPIPAGPKSQRMLPSTERIVAAAREVLAARPTALSR